MEIKYWALLILLGAVWGSAFIFIKVAAPEFGAVESSCFSLADEYMFDAKARNNEKL